MAVDKKLSGLTEATTLGDADLSYVVSGGVSKRITWANIKATVGQIGKNAIINGDFSIQQYPTDIDTAPVAMVNNTYQIDRFKSQLSGVTANIQRLPKALIDGKYVNSVNLVATSTASGYIALIQLTELTYNGEAKVFGAWVKSNNPNARILVYTGSAYVSSTPHTGGGTYEFLSLPHTIDLSATTIVYKIGIISSTNSAVSITTGDYIESTMWQLEDGSVATPFEQRPVGLELGLCKRYYEVGRQQLIMPTGGTGYDGSTVYFSVEKRTTPTLTISDTASTVGKITIYSTNNGVGTTGIDYYTNGVNTLRMHIIKTVASTSYGLIYNWIADAEL